MFLLYVRPPACVRLSGLGAARSLPNPSLTCLRVWDLLWLEQPSPSSVSLSSHVPCPTSQGSAKSPPREHWSAQVLQMCLSKVACVTPPDFPFYSIFRWPRAIWGIFRKPPGAFNLQTEVIVATLEACTISRWKVETWQRGHKIM